MLNRVSLIGRLTRDPELRYTPSGAAVATFTIAVDRAFKNKQGEREADFIRIVCWRKLAEIVAQYYTKGKLVVVDGSLRVRSFDSADGQRRWATEVVADYTRILEKRTNDSTYTPNDDYHKEMDFDQDNNDSDLPF